MIRTKPPSDVYRDGWDRVFGAESEPEHPRSSDGIDVRVKSWMWFCRVCDCYVSDPENHRFHVNIDTESGACSFHHEPRPGEECAACAAKAARIA